MSGLSRPYQSAAQVPPFRPAVRTIFCAIKTQSFAGFSPGQDFMCGQTLPENGAGDAPKKSAPRQRGHSDAEIKHRAPRKIASSANLCESEL
jgi:hypothetical protein